MAKFKVTFTNVIKVGEPKEINGELVQETREQTGNYALDLGSIEEANMRIIEAKKYDRNHQLDGRSYEIEEIIEKPIAGE